MNTDEKILQLLQTMNQRLGNIEQGQARLETDVSDLKIGMVALEQRQDRFEARLEDMAQDLAEVKEDLTSVKETVVRMEAEHGLKLGALFDAWVMNQDKHGIYEAQITALEEQRKNIK